MFSIPMILIKVMVMPIMRCFTPVIMIMMRKLLKPILFFGYVMKVLWGGGLAIKSLRFYSVYLQWQVVRALGYPIRRALSNPIGRALGYPMGMTP